MSKAGLKGMGVVIVTLMAMVHGSRPSTGIVLPLLIFADIIAVSYYRRHARWEILMRFLPWMILGVLVAVVVGKGLPEAAFRQWMAVIILVSVVIMFYSERFDHNTVPDKLWFAGTTGFLAGFSTMIGNLAGAFSSIFFLATRIPKNEFIGTAAWLYFIVNIIKLPFHIFYWETVNRESITVDLYLVPGVLLGFWVGLKVVRRIREQQFRWFILFMTAIGALVMLLRQS